MKSFRYREEDKEGRDTLEVIAGASRFNRWMYETIRPYCFGNILEIGSGIGNISGFFLEEGYSITLSDIRKNYCSYLEKQFGGYTNLKDVLRINLTEEDFTTKFSGLEASFDTVFALNVVEHIEDDHLAVQNAKFLLKPGGHLVILVPAYMALYNQFDKELGHYRRYNRRSLHSLFMNKSLELIHSQSFNFAGIAGWFVSGKLQKNKTIPGSQMSLYNMLVPVFRLIDKLIFHSTGLSVIMVGKKEPGEG